jgi:hypothetical protein
MQYPAGDKDFKDYTIEKVERQEDGTYAITCDGWTLWCGKECTTAPLVGQTVREYGKGAGYPVRGLFIDGKKVWYRDEAEQKEHHQIEMYGADAADWLRRWDAGKGVWSIEMGGLGPGYEQCIHITCAEILRWLLEHKPEASKWSDKQAWNTDRDRIQEYSFKNPVIKALGLSGAQWGAALELACQFYNRGPRAVMNDDGVKDRHIQVQKHFPGSVAA